MNLSRLAAAVLLLSPFTSQANTYITTNIVNGNWTLAGSPYIIQTNIWVPGGNTLTIDPGVEVRFEAGFGLDVDGHLVAAGTTNKRITFCATDTTGWYNDELPAGGWHGIHFSEYNQADDPSVISYCDIRDCKHGSTGNLNGMNTLRTYRQLHVSYSGFYHNQSAASTSDGSIIVLSTGTSFGAYGHVIELDHCDIHDNITWVGAIYTGDYLGGNTAIHHNHIYHNTGGAGIWGVGSMLLLEDNEVDHNISANDMSAIRISGAHVAIRRNNVHHNQSYGNAAITCWWGQVDIDNNLVTNNYHTHAACGAAEGGGGIHVLYNDGGSPADSTSYRIRNNVVANNYSPYGGGGLKVFGCTALIANNHIIKNKGGMGNAMLILGASSVVKVINNVFYGNGNPEPGSDPSNLSDVYDFNGAPITFDYNWIANPLSTVVYRPSGVSLSGDSTHNMIGTAPGLTNCTAVAGFEEDAQGTDFSLLTTSACINTGSNSCQPTATDFSGNQRINSIIDRGAFETQSAAAVSNTVQPVSIYAYPNPTKGQVFITVPSATGFLRILDVSGRILLVQQVTSTTERIAISDLKGGIYLVQYQGVNVAGSISISIQ